MPRVVWPGGKRKWPLLGIEGQEQNDLLDETCKGSAQVQHTGGSRVAKQVKDKRDHGNQYHDAFRDAEHHQEQDHVHHPDPETVASGMTGIAGIVCITGLIVHCAILCRSFPGRLSPSPEARFAVESAGRHRSIA